MEDTKIKKKLKRRKGEKHVGPSKGFITQPAAITALPSTGNKAKKEKKEKRERMEGMEEREREGERERETD